MSYWFSKTNFIASATLEVSSKADGVVGYPLKEGSGSAALVSDGRYSGPAGTLYSVEIDSVTVGRGIGQATFRWKRTDSSSGWEATGRATKESIVTLDRGVKIKWVGGPGDDFKLGDRWTIETATPFGPAGLHDLNRDTVFRSGGLDGPNWIKADLGSAKRVRAVFVMDHNISPTATLTLQANSTDSWASPPYEQSLTHGKTRLGLFLDRTYRYWRLVIQDQTNPDGLIEIGEWFVGDGLVSGLVMPGGPDMGIDGSDLDWLPRQVFSGVFIAPDSSTLAGLWEWYDELLAADKRRERPFLFCADSIDPGPNTYLMKFVNQKLSHTQVGPDTYRIQVNMIELGKTNV